MAKSIPPTGMGFWSRDILAGDFLSGAKFQNGFLESHLSYYDVHFNISFFDYDNEWNSLIMESQRDKKGSHFVFGSFEKMQLFLQKDDEFEAEKVEPEKA